MFKIVFGIDLIQKQVPNKPQARHSNYVAKSFNFLVEIVPMLYRVRKIENLQIKLVKSRKGLLYR